MHNKMGPYAFLFYAVVLVLVQVLMIDTKMSFNENSIWFYSGAASLLFGKHLLNPHFTPPVDALTNASAGFLAFSPAFALTELTAGDVNLLTLVLGFCAVTAVASIIVLITRPPPGEANTWWWSIMDRGVKSLGSPEVFFTILILAAAWLFHRDKHAELFAILGTVLIIGIIKPFEGIWQHVERFLNRPKPIDITNLVGTVVAHQSPSLVLIRQSEATKIIRGTPMIISDNHGPPQLGVALNYVGRDEGNLLRALTVPLPQGLSASPVNLPTSAEGVAAAITISPEEAEGIPAIRWINRLCGIVDSETSPQYLKFEVVNDEGLAEGCLAEVRIGHHRGVIYQIVDGVTHEEIVQQKNKYGYARAKARKIGSWNEEKGKFEPIAWMPRLNAPVFLLDPTDEGPADDCVGHFPSTTYGVKLTISDCVTHNTAILGILGVGKSYLAIELVERMIAEGIKVLCLDLTNQYQALLSDFIDPNYEELKRRDLVAAGKGGMANLHRELGGSARNFKKEVFKQVREFMSDDDDHFLRVINPAQFRVTKQTGYEKNGKAELTHLTASEITALFSEAALNICQAKGMTDVARLCLVYEEAHSLVPEFHSIGADGDKQATATSSRAILQGRKYGLGCLLITQRTANVTKTILNQCNTIFAMRTFDDTGKEFLGNYIGSDYANVLPSLQQRQAVVFGKGSSCENPVLVRLNDQEAFRGRFRVVNAPKVPVAIELPAELDEQPVESAEIEEDTYLADISSQGAPAVSPITGEEAIAVSNPAEGDKLTGEA